MELLGDGAPKDGEGLGMEGLQSACGEIHRHLTGHIHILVEDELDLFVLLTVSLDLAGSGLDLQPTAAPDGHFQFYAALAAGSFLNELIRKRTQPAVFDQLPEGNTGKAKGIAGNEIHIPKAHPLKIGGFINLDKSSQGLIQLLGKILPAGVFAAGQGNELAGPQMRTDD